jgi:hypothetical protein
LFGGEGTEGGEHGRIHCSREKQKYPGDFLNEFLAQLVEWDGVVGFLCILHFCPICFVDVGVRLVLFHDWGGVLEALETIFDIFWH